MKAKENKMLFEDFIKHKRKIFNLSLFFCKKIKLSFYDL